MTMDSLLRYPLALIGGSAFALVLFASMQGLLMRPATPTTATESALVLERVRLHDPQRPRPETPRTPPPQAHPPQPLAGAAPAERNPPTPLNLDAASPLQNIGTLALDLAQRTGQTWGPVDSSLVVLSRTEPVYPPAAARRGVEGWVRLRFNVDAEGSVQNLAIVEAQPPNLFDRAALQAVRQWRFKPRRVNGQAVTTPVVQTLSFRLGT